MCAFGISRKPRGAALVIVMLVTAVLLLAGMSFMTISSTETQIALNERASAQAQLLAEAAIHKAIARLRLNAEPSFQETNTSLGGGTFSVDVTTVAGCTATSARQVVATASVPVTGGTAKAEIRASVDTVSYPYRWAAYAVVPNNILYYDEYKGTDRTDKELWVLNTSLLDSFDSGGGTYDSTANSGARGHIGANGDVAVDYNTDVKGDIRAGDDIYMPGSVTVTGSTQASAASQSFPQLTPGTSTTALTVPAGQTVNLSAGTYHRKYVDFGNGASLTVTGPVTIYVTGPALDASGHVVRLGSNVTLGSEPGTQLRLITKSDGAPADFVRFSAGSGFRFYGSLYGTNTDVYIGDSSQIFGSLIGRTIMLGAGTKVHFDQAMSTQEVCNKDSKKFSIRRGTWREIIPN
ncbi:MAG TPA: pilus assembly PilX N-terminal domain-containing protein [Candidatus Methylomirabilis sp.]|nr:pilus assembly PilX N-terminal domain-containing protein [Candidatus Methylomirabilis sp.]